MHLTTDAKSAMPSKAILKWCVDTGTEIIYGLYVSSPDGLKDPVFELG